MVSEGDSLLQIIPEKIQRYYLVLWVPNEAVVGSWRPGNECDFRRELTKLFSRKGFVADIHPITGRCGCLLQSCD
jgi:hypothetical protein